MKKNIYLIDKLKYNKISNWQNKIKNELSNDFNCYMSQFETDNDQQNEIWNYDYFMIDKSDIIIINIDYDNDISFIKIGIEIERAYFQRKPIIIYSTKDWVKNNSIFKYHATKIIDSYNELIDYLLLYS